MGSFAIKILSTKDWPIYKALRLRSLQDSPEAFGSTYEKEIGFPDEEWIARLNPDGRARFALPLIVEVDGVAVGLAWGLIHSPDDHTANVYQMWVAPEMREQGLGKLLLDRIIRWAKDSGLESVALAVNSENLIAVNLYRSSGFVPSGELEPLRPGSASYIQPMILNIK